MSALLVVLPSWLGDTVMAEPAMRALRNGVRPTHMASLGRPGLAGVLEGTGLLDASIEHDMRGIVGPLAASRALRRVDPRRWDAIVLLPNSVRSALAARLVPAHRRVGFATDGRGWLLSQRLPAPARAMPVPAVDWYAELVVKGFNVQVTDRHPRLRPSQAQRASATAALAGVARPFALLNPGANRADKRWPADRFAAVGRALRGRGLEVVVNGGPAERALTAEVASACGGIDLGPRSKSLGTLVGVLSEAALLVTNDTGPRHVAIGLDVPTVSLFGPTDPRWTTIPGARERRLLGEPFLTEEEVADRRPKACRIDRIEIGDVLAAVDAMLPPAPDPGQR